MNFASFWKRVIATLIDWTIFSSLSSLLAWMVTGEPNGNDDFHWVNRGIFFLFYFVYCAALESSYKSATIGKQVVGIRVTTLRGKRISFARASIRYFGKLLSFFLAGFGCVMALFTLKRQALHDQIAKTLVLEK
ncbi:MAG: RDD family protein [Bacteroidetes bacterium]|nr:RDD family protein [Bacteroidota bacterium]